MCGSHLHCSWLLTEIYDQLKNLFARQLGRLGPTVFFLMSSLCPPRCPCASWPLPLSAAGWVLTRLRSKDIYTYIFIFFFSHHNILNFSRASQLH